MSESKNWRYEYKFVLDAILLDEIKNSVLLHPKMFFERYPMRRVNNIYFDTSDLTNYYDALAGANRRSKMRFRWYGESVSRIRGTLELKEKNGACVSKVSHNISNEIDISKLIWNEIVFFIRRNVEGELGLEFSYACTPVIINSYYRHYFETVDGSCRITLDYGLRFFDQRLFYKPNVCFQTPMASKIILEVKADQKAEVDLDEITNSFPFRITQNSKYTSGIYWI